MVSVFPSTAAHFIHQQPGTQVEAIGDPLEVKLCKPVLNDRIVTTRRIKSTCYHHFPIKLPYRNTTDFLKLTNYPILISANGTITPMPVLEDTISELPYFQTTRIHGYDDQLLTHSSDRLEP